jgi:hypothetical protein
MPNNYGHAYNRIKHDSHLMWRPGRVWLPAVNFANYVGAAGATAGAHSGAPVFQEISSFGVVGVLMDTAADEVNTYMILPDDIDLSKRIYTRVHWASGSTDVADTVTWKVWYKPLIFNTTAILAIGNTGGTALDKVVAAQDVPVATAYAWAVTEEGYLDAGKLPETTGALLWSVELDAFDAGLAEDKFLLGLEIRYSPRRLWGPDGMLHEAKAPTYIAGKHSAN